MARIGDGEHALNTRGAHALDPDRGGAGARDRQSAVSPTGELEEASRREDVGELFRGTLAEQQGVS